MSSKFRVTRSNDGRSTYFGPVTNRGVNCKSPTKGAIFGTPAIDVLGNIYIGSQDSHFYSLGSDASLNWSFETEAPIFSSPCLDYYDNVYFGSLDGNAYSLTLSGSLNWIFKSKSPLGIVSSPAINSRSDEIFIGSLDSNFYSIYSDGSLHYTIPTDGPIYSSPAVDHNDNIYIGSSDGHLYSINEGVIQWKKSFNSSIYSSPAISYQNLYFTVADARTSTPYIYCIDTTTGSVLWSYQLSNIPDRTIATIPSIGSDRTVYVSSGSDSQLYAFTTAGSLKWQFASQDEKHRPDNNVIVPTIVIDASGYIFYFTTNLYVLHDDGSSASTIMEIQFNIPNLPKGNSSYYLMASPVIGPESQLYLSFPTGNVCSISSIPMVKVPDNSSILTTANILFIVPLLIALLFSCCWLIHFRCAFLYHMRRRRDFEEQGTLIDEESPAGNDLAVFSARRARRPVTYLLASCKVIDSLPTSIIDNSCTICFSDLFPAPQVVNGDNECVPSNATSIPNFHRHDVYPENYEIVAISSQSHSEPGFGLQPQGVTTIATSDAVDTNSSDHHKDIVSNNVIVNLLDSGSCQLLPGPVVMLRCGHIFHEECIRKWAPYNNSCPVCRYKPSRKDILSSSPASNNASARGPLHSVSGDLTARDTTPPTSSRQISSFSGEDLSHFHDISNRPIVVLPRNPLYRLSSDSGESSAENLNRVDGANAAVNQNRRESSISLNHESDGIDDEEEEEDDDDSLIMPSPVRQHNYTRFSNGNDDIRTPRHGSNSA